MHIFHYAVVTVCIYRPMHYNKTHKITQLSVILLCVVIIIIIIIIIIIW